MRKQQHNHTADFRSLAKDARALATATAEVAENKVVHARERITQAVESGHEIYDDVRQKVTDGARAADEYVREKPYRALGAAVCAAAVLGYFFGRRR